MEERVLGSAVGDEVVHDRAGAGGLAHGGDGVLVAVQEVDVVLDPLEGGTLIVQGDVGETVGLDSLTAEETESTETVIGSNPDYVVLGGLEEGSTIVAEVMLELVVENGDRQVYSQEERLGSENVTTAKDPEENREVLDLTADSLSRNLDIQKQTVLRGRLKVLKNRVGNWQFDISSQTIN